MGKIKGQIDEARSLIKEQFEVWKKTLGEDVAKHREAERLLRDHEFDKDHKDTLYHQYLKMPESNRHEFRHLDVRTRILYVCCKSRAFTYEELAIHFGISVSTVKRAARVV